MESMAAFTGILTGACIQLAAAGVLLLNKDNHKNTGIVIGSAAVLSGLGCLYLLSSSSLSSSSSPKKRKLISTPTKEQLAQIKPLDVKRFVACFENEIMPYLVKDMKESHGMPDSAVAYMSRMLAYNVPGGKLTRGLTVVNTAAIVNGSTFKEDSAEYKTACAVGWGIELLQASFLVADDIMDSSITRRGQPCWYRNKDIGMAAVNDALVLLTQIDVLLQRYLAKDPDVLTSIRNLYTRTAYQTELGQLLDLTTQPINGPVDLKLFTMTRYKKIVEYKTAYYSFYAPVALGLLLAGVTDPIEYQSATEICGMLGEYFQIQDDYLDCYGSPEVIGKIGTDIQDSKCSWLVVQALSLANAKQKQVIEQNYGKHDEKCIATVKKIYEELGMENLYKEYEEKVHKEIVNLIQNKKGSTVPTLVYTTLLDKIYKRSK